MTRKIANSHGNVLLRTALGLLAVAVLLSSGLVMALVYTALNLLVAVAAVLLVVLCRRFLRVRWGVAALAALLIAVPPYPFWVFADNQGRWYFSFFGGFTLQNVPIGTFVLFFVLSLGSFAVLFWALPRSRSYAGA